MILNEILLKGWRSFDSNDGIILKDLKRINILIGPNNSGKSNIGKYFFWIKEMLKDKHFSPNDNGIQYRDLNNIIFTIDHKETWAWEENEIECHLKISSNNQKWINGKPFFPSVNSEPVSLQAVHNFPQKSNRFSVLNGDKPLISPSNDENPQVLDLKSGKYIDFNKDIPSLLDTKKYWCELSSRLVFIDPIRHYSRQTNTGSKDLLYYYDGSDILTKLSQIQSGDKKKWQAFETQINTWLSELLNESVDFRIEAHTLIFRLSRNKQKISATLNEIGTGVAQIFMILSFLLLNHEKELIVFIDEPESNLHPEAVKKLISIFESTFINHSFFITTHSSSLIDQVGSDWSIHRVIRKNDSSSKIFSCNTLVSKYEILDDLGIRASQILQSNLIIWVEGPSDRIYLNKWIRDVSKSESPSLNLEEGKHYSFLMYGGSNLSTHTILSENNDDIDILCTSRYSVIFCDSDFKSVSDETNYNLKNRVKKLINRFSLVKQSEIGESNNIENYIKIWITEGRETENYVPKDLFCQVLSTSPFRKTRLREEDQTDNLIVDQSLISTLNFSKFDSFDLFFAGMYKNVDGSLLTPEQKKKVSIKYSNDKVGISKEIVKKWSPEFYDLNADLKSNITEVINLIKIANGIIG